MPRLPRLIPFLLLAACLLFSAATPAPAGPPKQDVRPSFARENTTIPDSPVGAKFRWLMGVLNGEPAGDPTTNFTPEFLKEVPPAKVDKMLKELADSQNNAKAGGFSLVRINPGAAPTSLVAIIEAAETSNQARVELGVDPKTGKIDFLAVRPEGGGGGGDGDAGEPDPLEELKHLPGQVSVYAVLFPPIDMPDVEPARVLSLRPDLSLSIGQSFELWLLGAVADAVADGQLKWDQPVTIKTALKSIASGTMQLQPDGTTFPVSNFVDQMISSNDNTAADHLLALVGREKAEAWMASCVGQPKLNQPLLSTREMFTLKIPGDPNLPLRWNVSNERARRRLLAENGAVAIAQPNVTALNFWNKPVQIENIGWFATTPDLCRTMHLLSKLESRPNMDPVANALRLTPGIDLDPAVWHHVSFKGGSEPGVINLTWMLQRADARTFALSMTWNQNLFPLDETKFKEEARKLIDHLAKLAPAPTQE